MNKMLIEAKAVTMGAFYHRLNLSDEQLLEINDATSTRELVKENPYLLGHILIDIHEMLEIDRIDYKENTEFEVFPTVGDMISYFVSKLAE